MLHPLDDTLYHQAALSFEHVATSDPRFFDRYWFGIYDPNGRAHLISGLAVYNNMNVLDGFAAFQHDGLQHNIRLSRQLRPRIHDLKLGPLSITPVVPHRRLDLELEPGEHGFSYRLEWHGHLEQHVEGRHAFRFNGHLAHDYLRTQQVGTVTGYFRVGDTEIEVDNWFGARDHSWGVRPGVGAFRPITGPERWDVGRIIWFALKTEDGHAAFIQLHDDLAGNRSRTEGLVYWPGPDGEEESSLIVSANCSVEFYEDTKDYDHLVVDLVTEDGRRWHAEASPLAPGFAYCGTGYDGGYDDGLGQGVYRGEYLVEHDVYGLGHRVDVILPDGRVIRPFHREHPSRVTLNGVAGTAQVLVMSLA